MYTEKKLLKLVGKLAIASRNVINSNTKNFSSYIKEMEEALDEYDNAIISNINEQNNQNFNPKDYIGQKVLIIDDGAKDYPNSVRLVDNDYELDAFRNYQDAIDFCKEYDLIIV